MTTHCYDCKKSDVEIGLKKCPICFRHFCEEHGYQRSGLSFCTTGCADYFFHADPDE